MTEELKKMTQDQVLDFIREKLGFTGTNYDIEGRKIHKRFEMSGYESCTGQCTIHNLSILNEFAYLGIYDYTEYLTLDFYKGNATLYLKYFNQDKNIEYDLSGYTTSEIIHEIFKLTIFSGFVKRRRF